MDDLDVSHDIRKGFSYCSLSPCCRMTNDLLYLVIIWTVKWSMVVSKEGYLKQQWNDTMLYHEKLGKVWWTNQEWSILTYVKLDNISEACNVIKNDKQIIDGLCKANSHREWYSLTDCKMHFSRKEQDSNTLQQAIEILVDQYDVLWTNRSKRSVFDFIGEMSKVLFGTATEYELNNCKSKVETLEKEQKDVLTIAEDQMIIMKNVLDTFNETLFKVQQNENTLIKQITLATKEKDAFLGLVEQIKVIQGLNMLMRHLHEGID
jgi:hypothetical protein